MLRYFSLAKLLAQLPHVNTGLLVVVVVILLDLKDGRALLVSGTQSAQSQCSWPSRSVAGPA